MATIADIPEVVWGAGVALVGQAVLTVWNASSAWSRLREQEARLDKLESRMSDHDDKLDRLFSDVRDRLARIETSLNFISGIPQPRRPGERTQ